MAVPGLPEGFRQATDEELEAAGVKFDGNSVIHPAVFEAITLRGHEDIAVRIPRNSVLFDATTGQLSFPDPLGE